MRNAQKMWIFEENQPCIGNAMWSILHYSFPIHANEIKWEKLLTLTFFLQKS